MRNLFSKNVAWSLVALTASVLSFSSCSSNEDEPSSIKTVPLQVNAGIAQLTSRMAGTDDGTHTGGATAFLDGSSIDVSYINGSTMTTGVYTLNGNSWTGSPVLEVPMGGPHTVYGVYPSSASPINPNNGSFTVQTNQTDAAGYNKSDLMVAKDGNVNVPALSAQVSLNFSHIMARLEIDVNNSYGNSLDATSLTIKNANTTYAGNFFTQSTESGAPTASNPQDITVYSNNQTPATKFYAIIPPQTFEQNKELFVLNINGKEYSVKPIEELTFNGGYSYKLELNISSATATAGTGVSLAGISEWNSKEDGGYDYDNSKFDDSSDKPDNPYEGQ